MPTPVGPLGPDEIDPNDPDLWDWDASAPARSPQPRWIRITALIVVFAFGLFALATLLR